jgi:hypothetical protein
MTDALVEQLSIGHESFERECFRSVTDLFASLAVGVHLVELESNRTLTRLPPALQGS